MSASLRSVPAAAVHCTEDITQPRSSDAPTGYLPAKLGQTTNMAVQSANHTANTGNASFGYARNMIRA